MIGMQQVTFHIVGLTPYLQHNARLADPMDWFTREVKKLTDKGVNMTEADEDMKFRLQWEGGLYLDDENRVVVPGTHLVGAFVTAAKAMKKGQQVRNGVMSPQMSFRLGYKGPQDFEALKAAAFGDDARFRDVRMVNPRGKGGKGTKAMKCRPRFPDWSLRFSLLFNDEMVSREQMIRFCEILSTQVGLSDDRNVMGGRFDIREVDGKPYRPASKPTAAVNGAAERNVAAGV
jgi:hypothetical protein